MPARVVVVLDEPGFAEQAASLLTRAGYEAAAPASPMAALDLLDAAERIELLITCPQFGPGKPNGIALARIARMKRPGIKVVFIGSPEYARLVEGLGEYRPAPVSVGDIVDMVGRYLPA